MPFKFLLSVFIALLIDFVKSIFIFPGLYVPDVPCFISFAIYCLISGARPVIDSFTAFNIVSFKSTNISIAIYLLPLFLI